MSSLRKKVSKRLVAIKNETAIFTTFNEVDMTAIIEYLEKNIKNSLKLVMVSI